MKEEKHFFIQSVIQMGLPPSVRIIEPKGVACQRLFQVLPWCEKGLIL